jgi:CDP-diacylglycerol--serine O-phosphatidyltransferase
MRRSRKRRNRVNILPSLLTIGNMYLGLLSILHSINGQFETAAWMILGALILDGSDGHVARLTKSTSSFGKELDSLADVVTFGVAPAMLVYRSFLHNFEHIGVFVVTVYAITGALRLARYNIQSGSVVKSFTGLPIPGAGCLLASIVLMQNKYSDATLDGYLPPLIAVVVMILAFLMVSKITYPKEELFLVHRRRALQYTFIVILAFSLIKLRPTVFAFVVFLIYVLLGPVNYLSRNRLFRAQAPQAPQEREEPVT